MQQDLVAPDQLNKLTRGFTGNGSPSVTQLTADERSFLPSSPFRSKLSAAFEGERYD